MGASSFNPWLAGAGIGLGGLTALLGGRMPTRDYGMMAANKIPGLANQFYNARWAALQSPLQANAMQGANAAAAALRSGFGGGAGFGAGLNQMRMALSKNNYFNQMNNARMGVNNASWDMAGNMMPYLMQGLMSSDQMRYGMMGAGINAMGNGLMNWGKG